MFGDRRIIIRRCGVAVVVDAFFFVSFCFSLSYFVLFARRFISFLAWCNFSVSVVPGYDYMRLPNVPCIPGPISGGLRNRWMERRGAAICEYNTSTWRKEEEGRGGEGQRLRARPTQRMQSNWARVEGGMRKKDTRTGLCMCPIYGPLRRALAPAPHIYSIIYNHFFFCSTLAVRTISFRGAQISG